MKAKLISMILGLLLVVGASVAIPAEPASAHNFDNYSTYLCAAHRPNGTVLTHSWPSGWGSGWVQYWCKADIYGVSFQYWIFWDQDAGTTRMDSGYQKCKPAEGGIIWCGWPPAH